MSRLDGWISLQRQLLRRERDEELAQRSERRLAAAGEGGEKPKQPKQPKQQEQQEQQQRGGDLFPLGVAELTVG